MWWPLTHSFPHRSQEFRATNSGVPYVRDCFRPVAISQKWSHRQQKACGASHHFGEPGLVLIPPERSPRRQTPVPLGAAFVWSQDIFFCFLQVWKYGMILQGHLVTLHTSCSNWRIILISLARRQRHSLRQATGDLKISRVPTDTHTNVLHTD